MKAGRHVCPAFSSWNGRLTASPQDKIQREGQQYVAGIANEWRYLPMAIGIPLAIVQSARSIDRFHFRGIVRVFKISRHGLRAAFVLAAALTVGAQAQAATIDFGSDSWQQAERQVQPRSGYGDRHSEPAPALGAQLAQR